MIAAIVVLLLAVAAISLIATTVRPYARAEAATQPLSRAPDGRPLTLTFSDEFDTFRPYDGEAGAWRTTYGDGKWNDLDQRTLKNNKEAQIYVDKGMGLGLDPFVVRDGVLHIVADRAAPQVAPRIGGFGYTSGVISSQPSFSQRYGYFEIRARLPKGKGLWPAFWMVPADMSWPPEIDVMENIGDPAKVYVTTHSKAMKVETKEVRVTPGAFHTFAVAWDAEHVIWFIDGREVRRQPTPADMHKPMFLIANMAIGGRWAGNPDGQTPFPVAFEIDHIRAYQFAS